MGWSIEVRLSILGKTFYGDYKKNMHIKDVVGVKSGFKMTQICQFFGKKVPQRSKAQICAINDHCGWWGSSQAIPCKGNLGYLWLLVKI
jgi:hypothetical protein